jgi:polyferredoxin
MDKMGYARGLVKYSTQNAVKQHWSQPEILRHVLRPRVLLYSGILLAIVVAMMVSLVLRSPFKVDVVRDRGTLARIVAGGKIETVFRLQVMNATEVDQNYRIAVSGLDGISLASDEQFTVESTQSRWIAVRVQLPYDAAQPGSHPIRFDIVQQGGDQLVREKSVFLVPR